MRRHSELRKLLYEYLKDELNAAERARVEEHLTRCTSCSALVKNLSAVAPLLRTEPTPDLERPEAYWDGFPARIEARIMRRVSRPTGRTLLHDALSVLARPRAFAAASIAFVLVLSGFLVWQRYLSLQKEQEPASVQQAAETPPPAARIDRYLQRSKVLLVGINNMPEDDAPLDLSAERKASQELVHEARELKRQPLDPRASRLISDLEKIQLTMANMDAREPGPELKLVRHGIRQQNLLFKVRMAEALYRPGTFRP